MNHHLYSIGLFTRTTHALALLAFLSSLGVNHPLSASTPGTAFTYQGRLNYRGTPANGSFDLQFGLYDDPTGGAQWYQVITNTGVVVNNGLFTTLVDFGADPFDGTARWLAIAVATNSSGAFVPLTPRQPLTPAPYALYAANAGLAVQTTTALGVASNAVTVAGILNSNVTAAKIAGGQVVKSLNQLKDDVLLGAGTNITMAIYSNMIVVSSPTWSLTGNADTSPGTHFLGTIDSRPLDLRVNNARALRLEPTVGAPNVIGGAEDNVASDGVTGATISGGQGNHVTAQYATVGGGIVNYATASTATVGGGSSNQATDDSATVSGGSANAAQGRGAAVGGGSDNTIQINATNATIAGGWANTIEEASWYGTIAGGERNLIRWGSPHGVIGGGSSNKIEWNSISAVVAGGELNRIDTGSFYSAIGGGQSNNIRSYSQYGTIAGGEANVLWGSYSAIGGGQSNNVADLAQHATIAGGFGNFIDMFAGYSAIGGGRDNSIADNGWEATIAGGEINKIGRNSRYSAVGGGLDNNILSNSWYATIAGGVGNEIGADADYSVVGGGRTNIVHGQHATVGGGRQNVVSTDYATVGGGRDNQATGPGSVVGGGGFDGLNPVGNTASGAGSTIAGGGNNTASGAFGCIGGGFGNQAGHEAAVVGGGHYNEATNQFATVPGGRENTAGGRYSFAAGRRAKALHEGAFVWADSTDADFNSTANNQFLLRASGGVGIRTNAPQAQLDVVQPSGGALAFRAYNAGSGNYAHIGGNWYGVYGHGSTYDFYAASGPGGYGSASSGRWKTNVQPIAEPLAKVAQLRGVSFDWDAAHGGRHDVGMIAEEVGEVLPEIVAYETNGVDALGMDYSRLTPLLVEAIKAVQRQADARQRQFERKLQEQQNRIAGLEQRLNEMRLLLKANPPE